LFNVPIPDLFSKKKDKPFEKSQSIFKFKRAASSPACVLPLKCFLVLVGAYNLFTSEICAEAEI
jgi:hypothetical protein